VREVRRERKGRMRERGGRIVLGRIGYVTCPAMIYLNPIASISVCASMVFFVNLPLVPSVVCASLVAPYLSSS